MQIPQPREHILKHSVISLEEVLAVIIGSGIPGNSVYSLAQTIAARLRCGMLLKDAITGVRGVGSAVRARLLAAEQLHFHLSLLSSEACTSPEEIAKHCHALTLLQQEHFVMLCLDSRMRVTYVHTVSIGTLTASLVHPREAFRLAISAAAHAVAFVHNHPSENLTPSAADISATEELVKAGKVLSIPVVDHIIIGASGYTSLKVLRPSLFW